MADAKALLAIEEEVRAAVTGGGDAAVVLARLLDAIEQGPPPMATPAGRLTRWPCASVPATTSTAPRA